MRKMLLSGALFFGLAGCLFAQGAPVTMEDLSLMLRVNVPQEEIFKEVRIRKMTKPVSEEEGRKLAQMGASAELVKALKSPAFVASAQQIQEARVKQQRVEESRRREIAEQQKQLETPAIAASTPKVSGQLIDGLDGSLATLEGSSWKDFDEKNLADKKFIAVYFSAHWCGPCRRFTPSLVQFYNEMKAKHGGDFELIFVSSDESANDLRKYIREANMPWPTVRFEKIKRSPLKQYGGDGIPCLVVLDGQGKVLSDSYVNGEYVGPQKVMQDLKRLLEG